ncbi:MAG: PIN domain-containing protein [archaeon]
MVEVNKYLDTYALVEIKKGNPKFAGYLNSNFVINDLTLAEFCAVLLREEGEEVAREWHDKLSSISMFVDKDILFEAIKFRYENRKKNLSFFDAVGYTFAISKGYLFVTGDKEFEGLKGVEFVKK